MDQLDRSTQLHFVRQIDSKIQNYRTPPALHPNTHSLKHRTCNVLLGG